MALVLESKDPSGAVLRQPLSAGRNRFRAEPGLQYRVIDDQGLALEAGVAVKRVNNSLVVDGLAQGAVVELDGFFRNCTPEAECALRIDHLPNALVAEITPTSIPVGALQDGSFVMHAPSALAPAVPVAPEAESSGRAWAYAGVGLLAVGAAAGGGGGKSDPVAVSASAVGVPETPTLNSAKTSASATPVISGLGSPGSTITLTLDLGNNGTSDVSYLTQVGADGRWSVRIGTDAPSVNQLPGGRLPEGQTLLLARASNPAGSSAGLLSEVLAVDTTAPATPVVLAVTGDNIVNAAEAAAGVTVTGTAEPGNRVRIDWLGLSRTVDVDASGTWSSLYTSAQIAAAGDNRTVRAAALDALGNASAETAVAVTLNTVRPGAPAIDAVASDNRINRSESLSASGVLVAGSTVANGLVTLEWGGASTRSVRADAEGRWSTRYASNELPADGSTALRASATDASGNTGDAATRSVLIDRSPPALPLIGVVAGNDVISRAEALAGVAINGTAEAGSSVTAIFGGTSRTGLAGSTGAYSISFAASELPAAGTHSVGVRATDAAGNSGSEASRSVRVATTAAATPSVNVIAGNDVVSAGEAAAGVTVSGVAEPGNSVSIAWGSTTRTVSASSAGTYSTVFSAGELPADGTSSVRVVATNAEGNSSADATRAVSVDRILPSLTLATVTGDNVLTYPERSAGVTVGGTVESGSAVVITWGSATRSVNASGGSYSAYFDAASLPASGTSSVTARATDLAGNSVSASQTVSVNTTPTSYVGTGSANSLSLTDVTLANLAAPGASVDGRSGTDTLSLSGSGLTLDLTQLPASAITSFERVNLTGSGNNTVRLTVSDVLDFATSNVFNSGNGWSGLSSSVAQRQLVIDGNAGDVVNGTGGWTRQSGTVTNSGQSYTVYTSGTGSSAAMLLVDNDITRNLV